jgi:hypothetical protein
MENKNQPDRNLIAAMAMQAMLSTIYTPDGHTQTGIDCVAYDAVKFADALITELEKQQP